MKIKRITDLASIHQLGPYTNNPTNSESSGRFQGVFDREKINILLFKLGIFYDLNLGLYLDASSGKFLNWSEGLISVFSEGNLPYWDLSRKFPFDGSSGFDEIHRFTLGRVRKTGFSHEGRMVGPWFLSVYDSTNPEHLMHISEAIRKTNSDDSYYR